MFLFYDYYLKKVKFEIFSNSKNQNNLRIIIYLLTSAGGRQQSSAASIHPCEIFVIISPALSSKNDFFVQTMAESHQIIARLKNARDFLDKFSEYDVRFKKSI